MGETGTPSFLGGPDDVIARMGKGVRNEAAIIVPLGAYAGDPVTLIVREAKDMAVATGGRRVNAMGAVQLLPAPPTAGTEKVLDFQFGLALENEESAMSHFRFKRVQDVARRRLPGCQVNTLNLRTDRIERGDFSAEFLDRGHTRRIERAKS